MQSLADLEVSALIIIGLCVFVASLALALVGQWFGTFIGLSLCAYIYYQVARDLRSS